MIIYLLMCALCSRTLLASRAQPLKYYLQSVPFFSNSVRPMHCMIIYLPICTLCYPYFARMLGEGGTGFTVHVFVYDDSTLLRG